MKKILVADDSLATQKYISFALERAGFNVLTANDGAEALEKLSRYSFDLLILDMVMPNMDGHDVMRSIKTRLNVHGLPVIMMSGNKNGGEEWEAKKSGAMLFLAKPFKVDELMVAISSAFGGDSESG